MQYGRAGTSLCAARWRRLRSKCHNRSANIADSPVGEVHGAPHAPCRADSDPTLSRTRAGTIALGVGASVAHVVGSDEGGGDEWLAAPSATPLVRGITALELDDQGKITRLTTIYNSYQFSDAKYQALVLLAAEK